MKLRLISSPHSGIRRLKPIPVLAIHDALLDRACEDEPDPQTGVGICQFAALPEPEGWKQPGFDDAEWPAAIEQSEAAVSPRGGYNAIDWHTNAQLIWSPDLETLNTLPCRLSVEQH